MFTFQSIECPVKNFGDDCRSNKRFFDWAAATQHVESGGCGFGQQKAKDHVYQFVKNTAPEFLNKVLFAFVIFFVRTVKAF